MQDSQPLGFWVIISKSQKSPQWSLVIQGPPIVLQISEAKIKNICFLLAKLYIRQLNSSIVSKEHFLKLALNSVLPYINLFNVCTYYLKCLNIIKGNLTPVRRTMQWLHLALIPLHVCFVLFLFSYLLLSHYFFAFRNVGVSWPGPCLTESTLHNDEKWCWKGSLEEKMEVAADTAE